MDFLKYLFPGRLHLFDTALSLNLILGKSRVYSRFWVKTIEKCFIWISKDSFILPIWLIKAFLRAIFHLCLVLILTFYWLLEHIFPYFDICEVEFFVINCIQFGFIGSVLILWWNLWFHGKTPFFVTNLSIRFFKNNLIVRSSIKLTGWDKKIWMAVMMRPFRNWFNLNIALNFVDSPEVVIDRWVFLCRDLMRGIVLVPIRAFHKEMKDEKRWES